jgi:hypothetical protein
MKFQRVGVAGGADIEICSLLDREQFHDPFGKAESA